MPTLLAHTALHWPIVHQVQTVSSIHHVSPKLGYDIATIVIGTEKHIHNNITPSKHYFRFMVIKFANANGKF